MKQFKAKWHHQTILGLDVVDQLKTISHIITQHNALCDYLEEKEKFYSETLTCCDFQRANYDTIDGHASDCGKEAHVHTMYNSGCLGGAGYDPRYKGGKPKDKPSFSEAYKNKPEWTLIKVETKAYPAGTAEINPKTITLPKPEWWEWGGDFRQEGYYGALEACSKASGITYKLEG